MGNKLKICVYAITKNESKFCEPFMASTKGADAVYVTDTGSTDDTVQKLRDLGAVVSEYQVNWADWPERSVKEWKAKIGSPWRFDIARNKSLFVIPKDFDVCICLDLDEVLLEGWREHIERQWIPGTTTRLRYKFIWSHCPDGTPDVVYWSDKIHQRNNYRWNHPVHEVLQYIGKSSERQTWCDLVIEHHADQTKSRGQYFPLLELAVWEDPQDDRNAHYLGREYYNYSMWEKAKKELIRHLSLPRAQWKAERAASMRYIGISCQQLGEKDEYIAWLRRACAEEPGVREPWVDLAQAYYDNKDYLGGYYAASQALKIVERPPIYITGGVAWGNRPYDLAGTCACYIGLLSKSRELTEQAYKLDPLDQRIIANLKFVKREKAPGVDPVLPVYHILWPTVRPDVFVEAYRKWMETAENPERIQFHVAVNTQSQKDTILSKIGEDSHFRDFVVVGQEQIGKVSAVWKLAINLNAEPNDVIIVASDDVDPFNGWDKWLFGHFVNFAGCIVPNVTYEDNGPRVVLPILDFGCFVRLNRIIYHPSYYHEYADVELFDVLSGLGLIKDLRTADAPAFAHRSWRSEKRPYDEFDKVLTTLSVRDRSNYVGRSALSLEERLRVK